eukprot:363637-Chlamydomonas_euryale.AAC.5
MPVCARPVASDAAASASPHADGQACANPNARASRSDWRQGGTTCPAVIRCIIPCLRFVAVFAADHAGNAAVDDVEPPLDHHLQDAVLGLRGAEHDGEATCVAIMLPATMATAPQAPGRLARTQTQLRRPHVLRRDISHVEGLGTG